ncbi:transposase [Sulfurovum sp.]|uniref:transposase n=1 Tax=Sulfurovum sp. TaxID=1969726 RepID=UPI0025E3DEE3|nr:transposase [Sulfurovum sp.]
MIMHFKNMQITIDYANSMTVAYEISHPKLVKFLTDNLMDVITFLSFPKSHHRKIHSSNVLV